MAEAPSAVIVDAVRTPIGRYGGVLSTVRPDDLAARVIEAVVERTGLPVDEGDDVIPGCTNAAGGGSGGHAQPAGRVRARGHRTGRARGPLRRRLPDARRRRRVDEPLAVR